MGRVWGVGRGSESGSSRRDDGPGQGSEQHKITPMHTLIMLDGRRIGTKAQTRRIISSEVHSSHCNALEHGYGK